MVTADENSTEKQLNSNSNQTDLENDPLLVEGIKKYLIDFTFTTEFVNLLSFLRDLEFQDNVVLLNDINLSLNNQDNDDGEINKLNKILEVNLRVIFYGKNQLKDFDKFIFLIYYEFFIPNFRLDNDFRYFGNDEDWK